MKNFVNFVIVAILLLLGACSYQQIYNYPEAEREVEDYVLAPVVEVPTPPPLPMPTSTPTPTPTPTPEPVRAIEPWQEAYAALLRENYPESFWFCNHRNIYRDIYMFILHDITLNGIPEMIVFSQYTAAFYTFSNGEVVSIEGVDDDYFVGLLNGAARTSIGAAPENVPGFIVSATGIGGGFGASQSYTRYVVEEYSLAVAEYGWLAPDVVTLSEMFEDFGRGSNVDQNELSRAIIEHTHFYLNGSRVLGLEAYQWEEIERIFGMGNPFTIGGWHTGVNEDNINDMIFGWVGSYE